MMYPYLHGMGAGGWVVMTLGSLALLAVLAATAVAVVRGLERSGPPEPHRTQAEQVLANRFAQGEIDAEEYEQRLRTLRAH